MLIWIVLDNFLGLTEVGIYRISGENRVVHELKDSLNKGYPAFSLFSLDRNHDVHNITSLIKLYLRELPDPLIPHDFYDEFMSANMVEGYDERLYAIRDLVWRLPKDHFQLLRRLTEHLEKYVPFNPTSSYLSYTKLISLSPIRVTDHESINAMHGANLALVLAPTLLQPSPHLPNSFAVAMSNLGKSANLIKSLIVQEAWIFGTQEPEQDHEREGEGEVEVEVEVERETELEILPLNLEQQEAEEIEVLDDEKVGTVLIDTGVNSSTREVVRSVDNVGVEAVVEEVSPITSFFELSEEGSLALDSSPENHRKELEEEDHSSSYSSAILDQETSSISS